MNFSALKSIANGGSSRAFGKAMFTIRKYSPQILTTVGVAGVVTSAVLASKATLHLEPIIDEAKLKIEHAELQTHESNAHEYSSADHKKRMLGIYTSTAGKIGKLYGPSVALGVVSIGCIIGGQGVMHKRNVAMVAAYKGLEETFNKYRERIVEELGEDKEKEIRYGIRDEVVTDEKGKDQTVKVIDPETSVDIYFFDGNNKNWVESPDYNMMFLRTQEQMADQRLRAQGYLFLNDVLRDLGFEPTQAGAVTGWVMGGDGDDFVDFGIIDCQPMSNRVFGNDDTDSVLLNFNIDGVILHHLPKK